MPLVIRPYRVGVSSDADAWHRLTSAASLPRQDIWETVDENEHIDPCHSFVHTNGAIWLALIDDEVIGCIALQIGKDGTSADIKKLRVDDAGDKYIFYSVATQMLRVVIDFTRNTLNIPRITDLYISDHSSRYAGLHELYEKNGFVLSHEKRKNTADMTYHMDIRSYHNHHYDVFVPANNSSNSNVPIIRVRSFRRSNVADRVAWKDINSQWILENGWKLELSDMIQLDDPEGSILNKGGYIWVAESMGEIIGTSALVYDLHHDCYELVKIAVSPHMRGHGIGKRLMETVIRQARSLCIPSIHLESNTRLEAAISLYKKYGFVEQPSNSPYERCNITMRLDLKDVPDDQLSQK